MPFPVELLDALNPNISLEKERRCHLKIAAIARLFGAPSLERLSDIYSWRSGFVLIEHLFYLTNHLVEQRDHASLSALGDRLAERRRNVSGIGPITAQVTDTTFVADGSFQSPIFVLDITNWTDKGQSPSVAAALGHTAKCSLSNMVRDNASLCVLTADPAETSHLESYSVTALRDTIFMEVHPSSVRNGETIVHEAAHNWLNTAFDAWSEPLPQAEQWFSPWRGEMRPMAGIVHAAWAFSCVVGYLRELSANCTLSSEDRKYASIQVQQQRTRLIEVENAFRASLDLLISGPLKDMLRRAYEAALE